MTNGSRFVNFVLSKTTENLLRTRECVLNLPSVKEVAAINRYEPDKFGIAGLTAVPSGLVGAPRAAECPVQLEAKLVGVHPIAEDQPAQRGRILSLELRIVRVHIAGEILMTGHPNGIDPDKWRPLI